MKAIFLCEREDLVRRVYAQRQLERLQALVTLSPEVISSPERAAETGAELVFSTWGLPAWSRETVARSLPHVKAVFYAAGSVQGFARAYFDQGARVFSGWQANGVAVARYAFSQILLAAKGYFRVQALTRTSRAAARKRFEGYPGSYDVKVGLLGAGAVGSRVAEMLRGMDCEVLVYDPFLSEARAEALGVKRVTLEEVFSECLVVSNHLADLPETRGIIRREHLLSMPHCATFINTGRGAQLDERDLYDALTLDETRTALLDVLTDESGTDTNPLTSLPNCFVTPHIAGASGLEVRRLADYVIDAFEAFEKGAPSPAEVFPEMLKTMA